MRCANEAKPEECEKFLQKRKLKMYGYTWLHVMSHVIKSFYATSGLLLA